MAKYIFVTGGVVSSLGKSYHSSFFGRLLKSRGIKVTIQKFDPYINIDPGTIKYYQHGEVFVTEDGVQKLTLTLDIMNVLLISILQKIVT